MAQNEVENFKVVVIGGSAGSLEVVFEIIKRLTSDSGAVFIIVLHRKSEKDSSLENLLADKTVLPVTEVEDKETIEANHIYIAPADYHLLIENTNMFALDTSEKINYSRPSIDITFQSVAETFRENVIAVLLSGANDDGTEGLRYIKENGGYTIVQNPASAEVSHMPQHAINKNVADAIVDIASLSERILSLLAKDNQR